MPENAPFDPAPLAAELEAAWTGRTTIEPFGERGLLHAVDEAYAVQQAWASLRAAAGETTVGRKIGLTSPGMQKQMGVGEPDFGDLWGSRRFDVTGGVAEIPVGIFIQPRVEGELAFRMRAPLQGPGVTPSDVLAAAQDTALAVEIVDSRVADWRIRLVDTIADDASYGGFACGAWSARLLNVDLPHTPFTLERNGETCVRELGSAVLGSPLEAVAWLANKLGSFGAGIRAGDVVLSGSFGRAVPAEPGDVFTISTPGQPSLTVRMTH